MNATHTIHDGGRRDCPTCSAVRAANNAPRPLSAIAREIRKDWARPNYAAVPYLQAMLSLDSIDDTYGCDDARGIVLYFLGNAGSWRGETAKRIKAELRKLAGIK